MELHEALTQITEIRAQMARSQVFRGYRSAPVAASGLLAVAAAGAQALWISEPDSEIGAYLALWVGAAVVSALMAAWGMMARRSAWSREITWLAVEQFIPCLVAGFVLTAVFVTMAPEGRPMLPGLWQILFSLGVFASCRLLPRATFGVAVFYLAAGAATLALARGDRAMSPWAMGLPFGLGQFLAAGILYWTLERGDGPDPD